MLSAGTIAVDKMVEVSTLREPAVWLESKTSHSYAMTNQYDGKGGALAEQVGGIPDLELKVREGSREEERLYWDPNHE